MFGRSVFQSVVERLAAERAVEDDDDVPRAYRVSGLSSGFVREAGAAPATDGRRAEDLYRDLMAEDGQAETAVPPAEPAPPEEPPVMPAHLARLSPQKIVEDLALSPSDTAATLAEKRRRFARANHPDGVHESFREAANTRMKVANLLIDEALARLT
ncbi:hypothetical protein [Brevundimonas sp.]|uniref:hypothetical protein n=1 Tax=Brevundimonas sp. TaxID=1871086 RepID=UPI000DD50BDA|nr:hypothetical protein [Brevundimonas sp.]MBD3838073.1 hypothetical protein [Brevundimonas sp.]